MKQHSAEAFELLLLFKFIILNKIDELRGLKLIFIVFVDINSVKNEFAKIKIGQISTQLARRQFCFIIIVQFNTYKPNEIYKRKKYFFLN